MQKILYKGKLKSNKGWIEGYYVDEKTYEADFPCIIPLKETENDHDWAVIAESVSQKINDVKWYWEDMDCNEYTRDSWTGDIVNIHFDDGGYHVCYLDIIFGCLVLIGNTLPDGFVWVHEINRNYGQGFNNNIVDDIDDIRYIEAEFLGNRFDNPELLEGDDDEC